MQQAQLPVAYSNLFLDLARERGFDTQALLAKVGIAADVVIDPMGRISYEQSVRMIGIILAETGDDGIGLEVGLRQPLTVHGNLGLAMMCSATAGDALAMLKRFWHLRGRGIQLITAEDEHHILFSFQPDMTMSAAVRRVLIDSFLASFYRGLNFALPASNAGHEIWFEYAEPAYIEHFKSRLPTLRYGQPCSQYRVPKSLISHPLATASPETLAMAVALCERESDLLDGDMDHIVATTRSAMTLGADGYPEPRQLAEQLHMTPRTFRRRLQLQGCNYRQLLEDVRRRDSLQLLANPALEIQQIARLLGYSDPANFTRAFRLWTGRTPSRYRELGEVREP